MDVKTAIEKVVERTLAAAGEPESVLQQMLDGDLDPNLRMIETPDTIARRLLSGLVEFEQIDGLLDALQTGVRNRLVILHDEFQTVFSVQDPAVHDGLHKLMEAYAPFLFTTSVQDVTLALLIAKPEPKT